MIQQTRHKLYFGPYKTPTFKIGQSVQCLRHGKVTIVGQTDGRIAWPLGRNRQGKPYLILYCDLARAVRKEAGPAVMYWWELAKVHSGCSARRWG